MRFNTENKYEARGERVVDGTFSDDLWRPSVIGARVGGHNRLSSRLGRRGDLTVEQWRMLRYAFSYRCAYCGREPRFPVIEHVVPVSQGGETSAYNIVPACSACNNEKKSRNPIEWLDSARFGRFLERVRDATRILERLM